MDLLTKLAFLVVVLSGKKTYIYIIKSFTLLSDTIETHVASFLLSKWIYSIFTENDNNDNGLADEMELRLERDGKQVTLLSGYHGYTDHHQGRGHSTRPTAASLIFMTTLYNVS